MKTIPSFNKDERTLCCVYGCSSKANAGNRKGISFFSLPFHSSSNLLPKWVNAIKLPTRISAQMVVCSEHFLPVDFNVVEENKFLKTEAVPSRNLPRVWRNKFVPRTYGRLIKLIEVRGIGRLRLCFEAKLSRRLSKPRFRRDRFFINNCRRKSEKNKTAPINEESDKSIVAEKENERNQNLVDKNPDSPKIIDITDDNSKYSPQIESYVEHSLTSEIEIKDEPLSGAENEEEETVEDMLAKMNAESLDDDHITMVENDEFDFDEDDEWLSATCRLCGEDDCSGIHDFYCGPCDKVFKTLRQLNAHNLSHFEYRRKDATPYSEKEAICKTCGAELSSSSSLNEHMLLHSGLRKNFKCMLCDRVFGTKAHLMFHINGHDFRPHQCKLCGETFEKIDDLDEHVRSHKVMIHEYTCRGCGQHFKSRAACFAHLNSHMRAKSRLSTDLSCDICGRVLSTRATLKEHMFIHSGEKPFECQLCGKKVRHRANFIIHVQGHSLGQPHLCHLCGMGFSKKSELLSHAAAEHPEDKPYLCVICGLRFRTETRFLKHAVSHDAFLEDEI